MCWPHGRRDDYFAPDLIPEDYRQPIAEAAACSPASRACARRPALPEPAAREGGPRNGVRTAVEDFVGDREDLRLVIVPAFFGFGVVWHREAPYADELAQILDAWDRNTLLERLEGNRVLHLARSQVRRPRTGAEGPRRAPGGAAAAAARLERLRASPRALSRLRYRAGIATEASVVSKDEIRRALDG